MDLAVPQLTLRNLSPMSVILGKNGCGKSRLLRTFEQQAQPENVGLKKYVTPERGGVLTYEAGIEQSMTRDPAWMSGTRRANRYENFRGQSVAQYRRLELNVLREVEADRGAGGFDSYIARLNSLLDNVEIRRDPNAFKVFSKLNDAEVPPEALSSGESELISLGIEALAFSKEADPEKTNLLFLDEPDVHLHPDLQARLAGFLIGLVEDYGFTVIVATHSTALLGGLSNFAGASVALMASGDTELEFEVIGDRLRRILPVFGAHPLTNVFNAAPILLVEGDDDERIWQQAVRSSDGALNLFPVPCGGLPFMPVYEADVRRIASAVYDDAKAYSLRDGDGHDEPLDDLPPVRRFRLACRAAENLLLTDEVLESAGLSWDEVRARADDWIDANPAHDRTEVMRAFKDSDYDRKAFDLKELRMLLVGMILSSTKPWEVLVGQALGHAVGAPNVAAPNSLRDYLGDAAELLNLGAA